MDNMTSKAHDRILILYFNAIPSNALDHRIGERSESQNIFNSPGENERL